MSGRGDIYNALRLKVVQRPCNCVGADGADLIHFDLRLNCGLQAPLTPLLAYKRSKMLAMMKNSVAARSAPSSVRRCCPVTIQRIAPVRAVKLEKETDVKNGGTYYSLDVQFSSSNALHDREQQTQVTWLCRCCAEVTEIAELFEDGPDVAPSTQEVMGYTTLLCNAAMNYAVHQGQYLVLCFCYLQVLPVGRNSQALSPDNAGAAASQHTGCGY